MRIDRLHLESFGACQDVRIDFAPGLNFFCGENEEGKSTLIDGLLLALLGAPANAERRLRYAPLDGGDYRATVYFTAGDGRAVRIERHLAPGGRDTVGLLESERWVVKKKSESVLKELGLPPLELARATVVIAGSEVVLAAKDGEAVSKALSARATSGEGAVSGQQALKRLDERRRDLENKERKALLAERDELQRLAAELASAGETGKRLEAEARAAGERLAAARRLVEEYKPAVEAFEAWHKAREAFEECGRRHGAVLKDLQLIKAREEELAALEREAAALRPWAAAFTAHAQARFHKLCATVASRREAAAQQEQELAEIQKELALLRDKLDLRRRAGFTPEQQRELDRIDGAVAQAQKNLAEKDAALAKGAAPGGGRALWVMLTAGLAALSGLAAGFLGFWPGWILAGVSMLAGLLFFLLGRERSQSRDALLQARALAAKEQEMALAAFYMKSGGRSMEAWREEFLAAQSLAEEIRVKEAGLKAMASLAAQEGDEAAELAGLLQAAGCREEPEYEQKAAAWVAYEQRRQTAADTLQALLRGRETSAWEEQEHVLAREEAAAAAVLREAEVKAAGLEPALIARYREALAGVDLPALERAAAEAESRRAQHQQSAMRRDPWEIETGLALAEAHLAGNERRARAVRLAMEVLAGAVEQVQGSLVPRLEATAGRLFAELTGGRYDGLSIGTGADMLVVEPCRRGEKLPPRILSSGTADQMYLALRLALAEALQGPDPLPLILDDPFLTFDRPRLGHALRVLQTLAGGQQIILATKDETFGDMARRAGVEIRRLPGRAGQEN